MTEKEAIKVLDKLESELEQHDKNGVFSKEIEALNIAIMSLRKPSRKKPTTFTPPTVEEVEEYIAENGYTINAEAFVDYYESKGWVIGKAKMKDWKATVRNWQRREKENVRQTAAPVKQTRKNPFDF